ncbi:winged helix-turn-helix transcriptional regulator [Nocardia nepalensis]|uniref:winged helix-turn-helix transcriptional regulator n=1 Tax=Nocardia nepalensis TaxID=3375448 RepID=UPI003B680951
MEAEPPGWTAREEVLGAGQRTQQRFHQHESSHALGPPHRADGLVARRVEPTVPPRVHYRLTDLGLSLEVPLAALRMWAEEHMGEIDRRV